MTLDSLLNKAAIGKYHRGIWFQNCELRENVLLVSDIDDYGGITRQYLDRFREIVPDLVVTFVPPSPESALH